MLKKSLVVILTSFIRKTKYGQLEYKTVYKSSLNHHRKLRFGHRTSRRDKCALEDLRAE